MDSEPTYVYEKGSGWTPRFEKSETCIREWGGKRYRVTIVERAPQLHERSCHYFRVKDVTWFEAWENESGMVPAGFGFAIDNVGQHKFTVITEAL